MPLDATGGSTSGGGSATLTWTHIVAQGAGLIVFAGAMAAVDAVTGVTVNGVAMTVLQADTDLSSGGVLAKNSAWAMYNPPVGLVTIILTTNGTAGYIAGHSFSFTGINLTSVAAMHRTIYPLGDGGSGTGIPITVVDSVSGDLVLMNTGNWGTAPVAAQTGLLSYLNISAGAYDYVSEYTTAAGASTVMSFTGGQNCTNIAFALKPGPLVTVQPVSLIGYASQTVAFTVTATGAGTVHYQWKQNGGNVGTDSSTYTTNALVLGDNGSTVTVDVTDNNATVTSVTVFLSVWGSASLAWFTA